MWICIVCTRAALSRKPSLPPGPLPSPASRSLPTAQLGPRSSSVNRQLAVNICGGRPSSLRGRALPGGRCRRGYLLAGGYGGGGAAVRAMPRRLSSLTAAAAPSLRQRSCSPATGGETPAAAAAPIRAEPGPVPSRAAAGAGVRSVFLCVSTAGERGRAPVSPYSRHRRRRGSRVRWRP